ncbi:MAG: glycerol kinase GlpK, partial [Gammaproteobacteria bacterium]|nr:glycerol kinase GlpK [Gammaproteobacteria bacterium]
MNALLALDQGTTSSRALVFDIEGRLLALAQRELTQHYPAPGEVEHDPLELWQTQADCAREALASARLTARDIAAIGITNQRETTLVWERATGRPVHRALVWQDRRTAPLCDALRGGEEEQLIREQSGLVLDPYFSASKLRWLLDGPPALRARAERGELAFGTVDSWLVWQLSGGREHVTDATNAARTQLFSLARGDWSEELLALWRIPRALLPSIVDSSGVCASTTLFGGEVPIAGLAGDQQAALFGQACFSPGMAKCTYGTGCFILMHTGTEPARSQRGLLTTVASRLGGQDEYALEGSVFMGGAVVQWLRDGLGLIASAAEIEALAASVPHADGVVLVPAFTGLGAPHWDARARALLIGMTRGTTRAHIARAALDAIAWQVTDVGQAMMDDAGLDLAELRVDGGAAANDLLMRLQADTLGVPILRPALTECTAFGAAGLAALGVGLIADRGALAAAWRAAARFAPSAD